MLPLSTAADSKCSTSSSTNLPQKLVSGGLAGVCLQRIPSNAFQPALSSDACRLVAPVEEGGEQACAGRAGGVRGQAVWLVQDIWNWVHWIHMKMAGFEDPRVNSGASGDSADDADT